MQAAQHFQQGEYDPNRYFSGQGHHPTGRRAECPIRPTPTQPEDIFSPTLTHITTRSGPLPTWPGLSVHSTHSLHPPQRASGLYPGPLVLSANSTRTSFANSRSVHQIFEPVRSDELALTRLGEYLTVLKSFDDGWCLFSRDKSRNFGRSSLTPLILGLRGKNSSLTNTDAGQAGFGQAPAWVFVKAMKDFMVERHICLSSADALQFGLDTSITACRDTVVSWSDFA